MNGTAGLASPNHSARSPGHQWNCSPPTNCRPKAYELVSNFAGTVRLHGEPLITLIPDRRLPDAIPLADLRERKRLELHAQGRGREGLRRIPNLHPEHRSVRPLQGRHPAAADEY